MVRQGILGLAMLGLCAALCGQQSALLNFFAHAGSCEMDFDKNGRVDGWAMFHEGIAPEHTILSLDTAIRFAGAASQRVRLQRSGGSAGRFAIFVGVNFAAYHKPNIGEPLLVRLALRAEGFQNASYTVYVYTGSRRVELLPATRQDTGGWRQLSAVVPVESDASGAPQFSLRIEIQASEGAASGTLWIDEAQAISTRTVMRTNRLPNGLRLAFTYLYRNRDPYRYLDQSIGAVVGTPDVATTLAHHYPDVIWMPYCYMPATMVPSFYRHNADLYNYDDVSRNHPDWFLLDQNGQPIRDGDTYYMDLGRPEVRERAWQSLRDFLNRCGRPRYIYLDNYDMRVGPNRFAPPSYPTNDLWVQAVVGWTEYLGSRLRSEFQFPDGSYPRFVPNAAWSPAFWLRGIPGISQDAPGVTTLPYIGGFLIEHAFTHARPNQGQTAIGIYGTATGTNGPQRWDNWALRNTIRLATEYPDRLCILIPTLWTNAPDSRQKLRFAIAGCLIVQHDNTFVQIDPRHEQEQYPDGYYPPELFVPLGLPQGNFRILNGDIIVGGLFVREYQNGVVVWNPRHDATYTYTVPRDYYDWDRNLVRAGTQVQVPPQTGLVFYAAPEITISLSPAQANVLPGQTVEFTVRYRNTGTAAGTDVRISVPLPDGMTLVSSSPTARLENRQLVWTIPSVPVNGEGTLRFTVRVE
jgi:conserved repeat domain